VGEISQAMFRTTRRSKEEGMKSEGLDQARVGLIINTRGTDRDEQGDANCIVNFQRRLKILEKI